MLSQNLLERLAIDRAGVRESCGDLVAEHLLEPARGECLAAQLPVGLRFLRRRQHRESLVPHQLVVQLTQSVLPRGVALEAPTGEVVVVGDEDVCVRMTSSGVLVNDHHVVGGVHPLDQLDSHVTNPVQVLLLRHVELVGMKGEDVALELVLSPVRFGNALSTLDELGRGRATASHLHREGRSSRLPIALELLLAVPISPVQHVADAPRGAR